mmetsp:Transcript_36115/g.88254  ORF Transcript_36115/g.88254 Transcript_36115/m.88254 type:complete len:250 (-) Transcript_36115:31-780(-)
MCRLKLYIPASKAPQIWQGISFRGGFVVAFREKSSIKCAMVSGSSSRTGSRVISSSSLLLSNATDKRLSAQIPRPLVFQHWSTNSSRTFSTSGPTKWWDKAAIATGGPRTNEVPLESRGYVVPSLLRCHSLLNRLTVSQLVIGGAGGTARDRRPSSQRHSSSPRNSQNGQSARIYNACITSPVSFTVTERHVAQPRLSNAVSLQTATNSSRSGEVIETLYMTRVRRLKANRDNRMIGSSATRPPLNNIL